jgi:Putative DNA-binding domain
MIWLPNDETQLRDALDQGIFKERHVLDFKSALTPGRGANKELAKDLAQFAIDGGVLVIGVDDNDKTVPPRLTPVDLDGLKERVDRVARSIPDPPMHVRTEPIYIADTTRGYLFVTVPSTPYEPRQVDGVYYGRGDTTRYRLSAAEVERCYQLGLRIQRDITTLLDEGVQNDPWRARRHAHLFGVAQPVSPRSDLLLRALGTTPQTWTDFLHTRIRPQPPSRWAPDLPEAIAVSPRAWGWALSTHEMPGRIVDQRNEHRETSLLDVEVREDGGLRLFCGGASRTLNPAGTPLEVVMELPIVGLTKRLIMAAAIVADTADFSGSWDLGIVVIGLGGLRRYQYGSFDLDAAPYSEDDHQQTTRATHERLTQQLDLVVEELTGRMHRGLGGGSAFIPF